MKNDLSNFIGRKISVLCKKHVYSKPQNTFSHQKKTETIFLFSKMAKTIDNMTNHDFLRMGWVYKINHNCVTLEI